MYRVEMKERKRLIDVEYFEHPMYASDSKKIYSKRIVPCVYDENNKLICEAKSKKLAQMICDSLNDFTQRKEN